MTCSSTDEKMKNNDNLQHHRLGGLHRLQEEGKSLPDPPPVHWGDQQVVKREVARSLFLIISNHSVCDLQVLPLEKIGVIT